MSRSEFTLQSSLEGGVATEWRCGHFEESGRGLDDEGEENEGFGSNVAGELIVVDAYVEDGLGDVGTERERG